MLARRLSTPSNRTGRRVSPPPSMLACLTSGALGEVGLCPSGCAISPPSVNSPVRSRFFASQKARLPGALHLLVEGSRWGRLHNPPPHHWSRPFPCLWRPGPQHRVDHGIDGGDANGARRPRSATRSWSCGSAVAAQAESPKNGWCDSALKRYTPSFPAARVKPPSCATVTKACKSLKF